MVSWYHHQHYDNCFSLLHSSQPSLKPSLGVPHINEDRTVQKEVSVCWTSVEVMTTPMAPWQSDLAPASWEIWSQHWEWEVERVAVPNSWMWYITTLSATAPGLSIVGNRSLLCHYGRHTFCPLESLFIGEMYQPILLVFFSMAEMAYLSVRWERIDGECKNCRSRWHSLLVSKDQRLLVLKV